MASILRQIVASPRVRHEETGLDLVYVTDNIIAMSMPAGEYPKLAYRNPLKKVVEFLDKEHGEDWAVWEFRAEGTGYSDEAFHNRVFHSPWPDHHPPPFGLIPNIMASMRNHLKSDPKKVAVVHCKAGKGRTGTVTCSYLISEEGWKKEDALKRFTEKRMRPQFGAGVSIPSQLRYVEYVTQWTSPKYNKTYIERSVEVLEVHLWGLREGIKLSIMGFVEEGKVIKEFHVFNKKEKTVVDSDEDTSLAVFRPSERVVLHTNDVCIDLEKRTKATAGWTFVSSLAHCWFNCFFEGDEKSGMFQQEWEKMDGIKGTSRKGAKMFDKIMVVWKVIEEEKTIVEPAEGEPVEGTHKAPTIELDNGNEDGRDLGLRKTKDGDFSDTEEGGLSGTATPLSMTGKSVDASSLSKTLDSSSSFTSAPDKPEEKQVKHTSTTDGQVINTVTDKSISQEQQQQQQASSEQRPPSASSNEVGPQPPKLETASTDPPPDPGQITDQPRTASPDNTPTSNPSVAKIVNEAVSTLTDTLKKTKVGSIKKENEDEIIS